MKAKAQVVFVVIMSFGILLMGYCYLAIENQAKSVSAEKNRKPSGQEEPLIYTNCCILSLGSSSIQFLHGDKRFDFQLAKESMEAEAHASELAGMLADITVCGTEVRQIRVKQEIISAEDFLCESGRIRIGEEEYLLSGDFRAYDKEKEQNLTNAQLGGYQTVLFFIEDGKVSGAVALDSQVPDIRVVLMSTGFLSYLHEEVTVSSDGKMHLTYRKNDGTEEYGIVALGEVFTLKKEDTKQWSHILIKPENGCFRIESIRRSGEVPEYEGTLEVYLGEEGIRLVNELPVERYVMGVLPSEVPSTYDMEAIKAQAICARSYAFAALSSPKFPELSAHVDDSTNSQVYKNTAVTGEAEQAVKDTTGLTLWCNGKLGTAYYYSTSCGVGAAITEVWGETEKDYLKTGLHASWEGTSTMVAKLLGGMDSEEKAAFQSSIDLSKESEFRQFLSENLVTIRYENLMIQEEMEPYEKEYLWYRWKAEVPLENLSETVNENLKFYREKLGSAVKITDNDGKEKKETSIGQIKEITVTKRGKSGIATEVKIIGQDGIAVLTRQTAIRTVLALVSENIYRMDGEAVTGLRLLPSAFFAVDCKDDRAVFLGGGYGHGVGMSQNGANEMAEAGYDCREILLHFFPGTELHSQYGKQ